MPNARQTSLIASPSSSRATNRRRSSITEHSFHGIDTSPGKGKGVTHVSGTICHLCLGPLIDRKKRRRSESDAAFYGERRSQETSAEPGFTLPAHGRQIPYMTSGFLNLAPHR